MTSEEVSARTPLTPSEQMVLAFVRDGLLDAEIAVRLGVTHGDVKARIAALLRKLDLAERAALRTWEPSAASSDQRAGPPAHRDSPAPARPWPAWRAAGRPLLAAAGVAALFAAAGAWLFAGGRTPAGESAVTPAAVEPAPATRAFDSVQSAPLSTLRFVQDFDLREFSVLVETGCGGCAAGPDGIVRVTRAGRGRPVIDRLMPPREELGGPATSVAFDRDGWLGAITVCTSAGGCTLADASPVSATWLSEDGGVSWRKQGERAGVVLAVAWSQGRLLVADSSLQSGAGPGYRWLDGTAAVAPYAGARPVGALEDGRLLWALAESGQLALGDGSLVASPRFPGRATIVSVTPAGEGRLYAVWQDLDAKPARALSGAILPDGTIERVLSGAPAWTPVRIGEGLLLQTAGIPPAFVPGNWSGGIVSNPLVLDLDALELRPVASAWTLAEEFRLDRNIIRAYRQGPFVRVRVSPGECLPVYERPDPASPQLRCFAPGVLVRGPTPLEDPQAWVEPTGTWIAISWPGGTGWTAPSGLEWR